jgi:uncharacterized protein (TIGR03437 family)
MRGLLALWIAANASAQGLWERRSDYPVSVTEVSAAAIDGKAYVVCGLSPQGSISSLFIYDPKYDRWTQGADLPIPGGADHCNVAAAGGKLYVLGAIRIGTSFVDGNTYEYDPAVDRWRTVARMSRPRGASGVAAVGAKIYVAGGLNPAASVADFEVLDTVTMQWTRLTDMPTARDHLTAQAINGRVYAIAGRNGPDLNVNEEFDPATGQWRARAPIPTARGGLASGTIFNRIQVFGGEGQSGTPDNTFRENEEYDPVNNTWRTLAPMPTPRHGLYGVTLDDRIIAPSGGPRAGASYSTVVEALYLPPAAPPQIAAGGVLNAASSRPSFAPGSLVTLFGARLSQGEQAATRFPLPLAMNGVAVRVNGSAIPLLYVGPSQVNFLLPHDLPGGVPVITVSNAGAESPAAVVGPNDLRTDSAPGIFTLSPEGQGAIVIAGTGLVARAANDGISRPARRGEVVELYGTGLGAVTNPPPAGQPASATNLSQTIGTTIVTIGSSRAQVLFSGLTPGLAGVYQVNARVPADAPTGSRIPVTVNVDEQGLLSNSVTMAIAE